MEAIIFRILLYTVKKNKKQEKININSLTQISKLLTINNLMSISISHKYLILRKLKIKMKIYLFFF